MIRPGAMRRQSWRALAAVVLQRALQADFTPPITQDRKKGFLRDFDTPHHLHRSCRAFVSPSSFSCEKYHHRNTSPGHLAHCFTLAREITRPAA